MYVYLHMVFCILESFCGLLNSNFSLSKVFCFSLSLLFLIAASSIVTHYDYIQKVQQKVVPHFPDFIYMSYHYYPEGLDFLHFTSRLFLAGTWPRSSLRHSSSSSGKRTKRSSLRSACRSLPWTE